MKKIILGLMTATMTLTAAAQVPMNVAGSQGSRYNGNLTVRNMRNIPDNTLQAIGRKSAATPLPTKAEAAELIKAARTKAAGKAKAGKAASAKAFESKRSANKFPASELTLFESFENWDGTTFNWIPDNWSKKSTATVNETTNYCPTWTTFRGDGYYTPYAVDGNFYALCSFSEEQRDADGKVIAEAEQQDEWLVSPTTQKAITASNYLHFDLGFAPIYTFLKSITLTEAGTLDKWEIDLNNVVYDLEILVATNMRNASYNESAYNAKIFKLSDIVREMIGDADLTDAATVTSLLITGWHHYSIPLGDFAGNSVRVAFRYTGKKGGSVMLDAVRISDKLPMALYDKPDGSFYWGFSNEGMVATTKGILIPAYTNTTWRNFSNDDADSFTWNYEAGNDKFTSTDRNLAMPGIKADNMLLSWPVLEAKADNHISTYNGETDIYIDDTFVQRTPQGVAKVGGMSMIPMSESLAVQFAAGNFDATKLTWTAQWGPNSYAFGTGSASQWAEMTNYQYGSVDGIGELFETPAAPYVFNQVILPLESVFNLGATISCTIYRAKALGYDMYELTDEVIAQATTSIPVKIESAQGTGQMFQFDFAKALVINEPIYITITGFSNTSLITCAPLSQAYNHDNGRGTAFVILKSLEGKEDWHVEVASMLAAINEAGNMAISHCIGLNATFPYMHSNDGNIFDALTTGETKTFDIDSYWYPTKSDGNDLNGWEISSRDAWVKAELDFTEGSNTAGVKIEVEPLPGDVKGRYTAVCVKGTGCEEYIVVKQGDVVLPDGIESVVMDSKGIDAAYSITGQRISPDAKGIVITKNQGKYAKFINK